MELTKKLELINQELELENKILKNKLLEKNEIIQNIQKENEKQQEKIKEVLDINKGLREELDTIIYSRSYKIIQKFKKIVKRR